MMQNNEKNTTNQNQDDFDFSYLYDTFSELLTASDADAFPVDFDQAWQWVGYSRKSDAKEVLLKTFVENDDYVFLRNIPQKSKKEKGRPSEQIYLALDCFKSFCMLANTEKGKQVRRYFIDCEKKLHKTLNLVRKSQEVFMLQAIQKLDGQVQELEKWRKERLSQDVKKILIHEMQNMIDGFNLVDWKTMLRKIAESTSRCHEGLADDINKKICVPIHEHEDRLEALEKIIQNFFGTTTKDVIELVKFYVMQEGETNSYKLGITAHIDIRETALSTGNSQPLSVVLTIDFRARRLAKSFETHLHDLFRHKHIQGEWFKLEPEDLIFIEQLGLAYQAYQYKRIA